MMKSIGEVLSENDPTPWTGSEATYEMVRAQVEERWGKKVADSFRASHDARTFREWMKRNFIVNRGESGLKTFVVLKKIDKNGAEKKIMKRIWVFHRKQVSRLK
jgi:hypothetical protein